jgi:L-lactate dehydrogenase complex protein LldG
MIDDLTKRFTDSWEHWGGTWELWENPVAARLALLHYLREANRRELLAWQAKEMPVPGLQEAMADAGITLLHPHRRNLSPDVVMGLTSADAALAASGSLVLAPAPGRSWLPALIPIRHVVLMPTSRIYANLGAWRQDWLRTRPEDAQRALIISGPSVSDDIELHKHYGMFGPRYIHLLLFHE